jgi:hypothetical protein
MGLRPTDDDKTSESETDSVSRQLERLCKRPVKV